MGEEEEGLELRIMKLKRLKLLNLKRRMRRVMVFRCVCVYRAGIG